MRSARKPKCCKYSKKLLSVRLLLSRKRTRKKKLEWNRKDCREKQQRSIDRIASKRKKKIDNIVFVRRKKKGKSV